MTNLPDSAKPLRVSELNTCVDHLLSEAMPAVWVEGELTDWKPYGSGHIYFGLKEDDRAKVDAVMWKSYVPRLPGGINFAKGMAVVAFGTVGIYAARGQYQLSVQKLFPRGLGAAEEALRRLKEKLLNAGYFKPERKRAIPRYPARIGVITSGQGAAIRDILEIFVRRWPSHDVVVVPVRVQGERAAGEISAAVNQLNQIHRAGWPLDAIILGRGGGSAEDLAAFNDEGVAHAIFRSVVPIISAVGHEIDTSIADLVADLRATTPTNAAEICTQHWAVAKELLGDYAQGMSTALLAKVVSARRRLEELQSRRPFRFPLQDIRNRQVRLDELFGRLSGAAARMLERKKALASHAAGKLNALSPLNVLTRGYSLTQRESGELILDANSARVGDTIITRLKRGRLQSMVTAIPEVE